MNEVQSFLVTYMIPYNVDHIINRLIYRLLTVQGSSPWGSTEARKPIDNQINGFFLFGIFCYISVTFMIPIYIQYVTIFY